MKKLQINFKTLLVTRLLTLSLMSALPQATLAQAQQDRGGPPQMTDAQKKCFTDHGLTAPGDGPRPSTRPDHAVIEKVDACLKENGRVRPAHGPHAHGGPKGRGGPDGPPPPPEENQSENLNSSGSTSAAQ